MEAKLVPAHFLTEAQKQVKQKIMERLMEVIPEVLNEEKEVEFDNMNLTDLVISCLIMFCRDQLAYFFLNSNALETRDQVMMEIFSKIQGGVNRIIEESLKHDKSSLN